MPSLRYPTTHAFARCALINVSHSRVAFSSSQAPLLLNSAASKFSCMVSWGLGCDILQLVSAPGISIGSFSTLVVWGEQDVRILILDSKPSTRYGGLSWISVRRRSLGRISSFEMQNGMAWVSMTFLLLLLHCNRLSSF